MKIAAIGDTHIRENSKGIFSNLFSEISQKADILLLCGDLTDQGLPLEAKILIEELTPCKIPIVGVLGNHDFDGKKQEEIKKILSQKITILETEPVEIKDIGFAGTKGFGGGFDNHILGSFGEEAIKKFVYEAVNEELRLENAISRLKTKKKVVLLHYSPIKETVEGEPLEIYPFLGSSRLSEPIDNFDVSTVFHGHCHYGKPIGKTIKGIPVYNVTYPLLKKLTPEQPYVLIEI